MSMRKTQWALLMAAGVLALSGCGKGTNDTSNGAPLPVGTDSNSYLVTSAGRLVGFDLNNPSLLANAHTITGLVAGDVIVGTAFRPNGGALYAVTTTSSGVGKLYTIDPATGIATLAFPLTNATGSTYSSLSGTTFAAYFNPVPDRLRLVSNNGQNLRINVADGTTTVDAPLSGATMSADGVAYTNQFNDACSTTIYYTNSSAATDQLYTSTAPNAGVTTAIGTGFGVGDITSARLLDFTGFTGSFATGPANTLYGVFTVGGVTALYTVNTTAGTTAGTATKIANLPLASGESVVASATRTQTNASPAQIVDAYALTTAKRLVSFNVNNPGKLCSNRAVSGISGTNGDDTLVGIDRRISGATSDPTTLYGIGISASDGTAGTLYTITNIGGAAARCSLTFSPALTGTNYGVNFNPVSNAIRVVSDSAQNMRVSTTVNDDGSCTVTPDTTLSPVTTKVAAISYTGAAAGAMSTTLYGIDSTAVTLVRIGASPATANACPADAGNPNCGVVTTVGPLTGLSSGTLQKAVGFEISNYTSTAYGAFAVDSSAMTPATLSTLYTVNTASGAVTSVGQIGPTGSTIGTVKSLTTKGN